MSALADVQIALVDRLLSWNDLTALVGDNVFDRQAPQGPDAPQPPYLIVASSTEVPWTVFGESWSDTFTLTAWVPGHAGQVPAARIIAEATAALRSAPLTVSGYRVRVLKPEINESLFIEGAYDARAARYRIIAAQEAA